MRSHWGYKGHNGPTHWGALDPAYKLCDTGRRQSPIDIVSPEINPLLKPLAPHYRETEVTVVNNGHAIQVNCDKGSTLIFDEEAYILLQFHFHSPSEHQIGRKPFAMETHLVHQGPSGELVVIGVLTVEGRENGVLAKFWGQIPPMEGEVETGTLINVADLLPADPHYYTYDGSLTTPPCTEDVRWFVMKEPLEVSRAQVDAFLGVIGANARPVQPLNDRVIEEF